MRIGGVRELTPGKGRVALASHAVYELVQAGHRVFVEKGAGEETDLPDGEYGVAGARLVGEAAAAWCDSELIGKVNGLVPAEYGYLREGLIMFGFLSLSVNDGLLEALLSSRCSAFSIKTIRDEKGGLPVPTPMSEIAGRLVTQIGAHYLQRPAGEPGILLGGATGARPSRVVLLRAGVIGSVAARVASGVGAEVVVMDRNLDRLRCVESTRLGGGRTLTASSMTIEDAVPHTDLLISAVLVVGLKTRRLVGRETFREMREGSVIVDVDMNQGGSVETSRPMTLLEPIFIKEGVTHYCAKNVRAAIPATTTHALSNALLPYTQKVADRGLVDALNLDAGLGYGAAVVKGHMVNDVLAYEHAMDYHPLKAFLPLYMEAR